MDNQELGELRLLATDCNLHSRELLFAPNDLVLKVCNGIGPSWFPVKFRQAIDALHPSLKVVAAIHDLRYYYGNWKDSDFHDANNEFAYNGYIVSRYLFNWYNPRRYKVGWDAANFAKLCDIGGRIAYYNAIAERERDNAKTQSEENKIEDLISGRRLGVNNNE